MSAVLEWHRKTTRYTDSELRRTHLGFTLYPERAAEFWARVEAVAAGAGSPWALINIPGRNTDALS